MCRAIKIAIKPGNEGPNLVIDFRPLPMGDCNYMPIVVNIAQDLNNLYIVLYKNWSQIKKNRDWSRNSDALPTNTYRFSASELRNDQRSSRLNFWKYLSTCGAIFVSVPSSYRASSQSVALCGYWNVRSKRGYKQFNRGKLFTNIRVIGEWMQSGGFASEW